MCVRTWVGLFLLSLLEWVLLVLIICCLICLFSCLIFILEYDLTSIVHIIPIVKCLVDICLSF